MEKFQMQSEKLKFLKYMGFNLEEIIILKHELKKIKKTLDK